jgi:predicted transcriptional regulator
MSSMMQRLKQQSHIEWRRSNVLELMSKGEINQSEIVQLSFNQLKEYIPYLQHKELISYDAKRRVYRTTKKGTRVLELYDKINELVSSWN